MSKVLCVGGAGFIGSHLVDRLLKEGHQVIVIDDFSTGRWENLQQHHLNILIYKRSILDDIGGLFEGADIVFHLAALTRPQKSIKEPKPYDLVNVHGMLNVLLNCRDSGIRRVVFASSASLYGEQDKYPTPETAEPNPMSPYALQKVVGEQYCRLFTNIYGLSVNCLRFFNVYGDRMNPDSEYSSLIPKFIKLIKNNIRPTINGSGEQARDFVHIDDVVEAMVLASKSDVSGEVFNVGSGRNVSVNDVFRLICRGLGREVDPIKGLAVIEPTQTLADIRKIKRVLGWEPKVSLEEGLERMLK